MLSKPSSTSGAEFITLKKHYLQTNTTKLCVTHTTRYCKMSYNIIKIHSEKELPTSAPNFSQATHKAMLYKNQ